MEVSDEYADGRNRSAIADPFPSKRLISEAVFRKVSSTSYTSEGQRLFLLHILGRCLDVLENFVYCPLIVRMPSIVRGNQPAIRCDEKVSG
jgi:hypothetical protein